MQFKNLRSLTALASLLVASALVSPVAGASVRYEVDAHPGVRVFYRGQELHEIVVTVDTIAGSLFINGMSVLDVQRSLTEVECRDRWGKVKFISERQQSGRSCLEALDDYNRAIDVCISKIRAAASESKYEPSADSDVLLRELWDSVDELPEATVIAEILIEHGVPAVQIDGAPRPIRLLSASASPDFHAVGAQTTPGARLVAYAETIVNMIESPYNAPALVAVAKGGGMMRVVGDDRVMESLNQIEHYHSKGFPCKGPLTEAFFR